jgi:protein-tyrosine phosphatase
MRPDLRRRPPGISAILPALFVGEYPRVADVEGLRAVHAITAVLCLQDDVDLWDKGIALDRLEEAYRHAGILFRRVPVEDYEEAALDAVLGEAVAALGDLLDAGHTVLVHCSAGYNRAPTLAVAYLCERGGMTLSDAVAHVKARRPCMPYLSLLRRRFP